MQDMWTNILLLFLSQAWGLDSGTNENSSVRVNTTPAPKTLQVNRKAAFNLGTDGYLNCSDKTWSETMYVIWNIQVKNKTCKISITDNGQSENTCDDDKSLRKTSSGHSSLHIPNFSAGDVGVYKCEAVFRGGSENYDIDVTLTVSPVISAWLEQKDNKMVAVCRAERGNPAANITWSYPGGFDSLEVEHDLLHDFATVESRLELLESVKPENLSCIVKHKSWKLEKTLVPEPKHVAIRDMMWINLCVIFFSGAWSLSAGTNENSSGKVNTTSAPKTFKVNRKAAFNLGTDGYLNCSDKTWSETMYVIWNIQVKNKTCKISISDNGQSENTCNDDKSLRKTSSGHSSLHIPNFSAGDVGVYKCEAVFRGGSENYDIDVTLTVSPVISAWLEQKDNKMVAVCRAERGNPAANITWSYPGGFDSLEVEHDSEGFATVESSLELLESVKPENLSCIVKHKSWKLEKTLVPEPKQGKKSAEWLWVPVLGVIILILVGLSLLALKQMIMLRRCKQADSKSPPTEDVEEVEPYASYIQRVNSIYN
ncbi:cell surface glycoprotein CD200 receptor 1 [Menidia menidia]